LAIAKRAFTVHVVGYASSKDKTQAAKEARSKGYEIDPDCTTP
jgi:hypothetical protein